MTNMADEMTGCHETPSGLGKFYNDKGVELTDEQAQDEFLDSKPVHVPNAGSGSYDAVLKRLGYVETKEIEWTSSAGDWTIAARDDDTWYIVSQSNRHPYHGFSYYTDRLPHESYEQACEFASMG